MSTAYTCPHCGTEYEVPPKWCPCQPYQMDLPESRYFICEGKGEERKCLELSFREFDAFLVQLQFSGKLDETRCRMDGLEDSRWNLLTVTEHVGIETAASFSEENLALEKGEFDRFKESIGERSETSPPD